MHKVGNVCIFVVIQFGNKQYREISHFNMNSNRHDKLSICIEIDLAVNYFQFITIRSCTKMSILQTLCIT